MGLPITVLKGDNISEVENGVYIHCKELKKGLLKKDFSALGVSVRTFENIATAIEAKDSDFLEENGLDSVLFGAVNAENQGLIEKSKKIQAKMEKEITEMFNSGKSKVELEAFINANFSKSKYFNLPEMNTYVEEITSVVTEVMPEIYTSGFVLDTSGEFAKLYSGSTSWGLHFYIKNDVDYEITFRQVSGRGYIYNISTYINDGYTVTVVDGEVTVKNAEGTIINTFNDDIDIRIYGTTSHFEFNTNTTNVSNNDGLETKSHSYALYGAAMEDWNVGDILTLDSCDSNNTGSLTVGETYTIQYIQKGRGENNYLQLLQADGFGYRTGFTTNTTYHFTYNG